VIKHTNTLKNNNIRRKGTQKTYINSYDDMEDHAGIKIILDDVNNKELETLNVHLIAPIAWEMKITKKLGNDFYIMKKNKENGNCVMKKINKYQK